MCLNRRWVDADVRITTGFVEPHFFAGFSGGPKLVAPGLAGLETVLTLHDAQRIGDPRATWGICEGNPVHDDVRRGRRCRQCRLRARRGAQPRAADREAFGGPARDARRGQESARELAMQPVPALFDVVVTTGSGYPLDQNLYQAVKGMSAAATGGPAGGTIVCAAECRDGFPDHGSYREVLASEESPEALFDDISPRARPSRTSGRSQIQASLQIHARRRDAHVYLTDAALADGAPRADRGHRGARS